jgi:HEPN domain-containing protein
MKPISREWVEKAEGDFATARREKRARWSPNPAAACFHAQQCAEKYLKALLQEADTPFPKTHDLEALLDLLVASQPDLAQMREALAVLTEYAVAFRYPGERATPGMAADALRHATRVRNTARELLGLPRAR